MIVVDLNEDIDIINKNTEVSIALGNFDGIHKAHVELIKRMIKTSKNYNLKSSVLLFENHTKEITNDKNIEILTTQSDKLKILNKLGVDIVFKVKFDKDIMKLKTEEFVEEFLMKKLNVKSIVVGFDYRFGYKAKGSIKDMQKLCLKNNLYLDILDPIYENKLVSSTQIRKYIKNGDIIKANKMLGRSYSIKGKVVDGKKRGRTLGFPTANTKINGNYLIPKIGIYKTYVVINDKKYLAATNIGKNLTFEAGDLKIESYIIDFNKDIYDEEIEIRFVDYIRDEIKFSSKDMLINQIKKDVEIIKKGKDL